MKKKQERLLRTSCGLTRIEAIVIFCRFILEDPLTLSEIGDMFGVSRERIRQLEFRGKRKLQSSVLLTFIPAARGEAREKLKIRKVRGGGR